MPQEILINAVLWNYGLVWSKKGLCGQSRSIQNCVEVEFGCEKISFYELDLLVWEGFTFYLLYLHT